MLDPDFLTNHYRWLGATREPAGVLSFPTPGQHGIHKRDVGALAPGPANRNAGRRAGVLARQPRTFWPFGS